MKYPKLLLRSCHVHTAFVPPASISAFPASSVLVSHSFATYHVQLMRAGIPQESLVGILTARGWPEKDVYDALAEHYQLLTGIEIPRRGGSGASAREAFFYLLIFSTLATWTIGFGCLAFALIDRWLADPLFNGYQQSLDTYVITSSLAALIVAFPLYLLISRTVLREAAAHPEKLESSIRKWLTYMALVIAASVFMGDLITALAYLLRGELTSRFLAKSFVVLLLSGGVFSYYFGGLRKTDVASAINGPARDRLMAAIGAAAVVLLVILGFFQLGPPRVQRDFRADAQRNSINSAPTSRPITCHMGLNYRRALLSSTVRATGIQSRMHLMNIARVKEASINSARPSPGRATSERRPRARIHGYTPPDTTASPSTPRRDPNFHSRTCCSNHSRQAKAT
jgi:hypothetical protein